MGHNCTVVRESISWCWSYSYSVEYFELLVILQLCRLNFIKSSHDGVNTALFSLHIMIELKVLEWQLKFLAIICIADDMSRKQLHLYSWPINICPQNSGNQHISNIPFPAYGYFDIRFWFFITYMSYTRIRLSSKKYIPITSTQLPVFNSAYSTTGVQ